MIPFKDIMSALSIAVFVLTLWIFLCTKVLILSGIMRHSFELDSIELGSFVLMIIALLISVRNFVIHSNTINSKNLEKSNNLKLRLDAIDKTNVVIEFDPDGNIISINNKFKEIWDSGHLSK